MPKLNGRLYIVKLWIKRYRMSRGGNYEDYEHKTEVVFDDLAVALAIWKDYRAEVKHLASYKGFFGAAELYEASFGEYGRLHNFPGDGQPEDYIALYKHPHAGDIIEVDNLEQFRKGLIANGETKILGEPGGQQAQP